MGDDERLQKAHVPVGVSRVQTGQLESLTQRTRAPGWWHGAQLDGARRAVALLGSTAAATRRVVWVPPAACAQSSARCGASPPTHSSCRMAWSQPATAGLAVPLTGTTPRAGWCWTTKPAPQGSHERRCWRRVGCGSARPPHATGPGQRQGGGDRGVQLSNT